MQTDSKQQSFSLYSVCPVRFDAVLSLPLTRSLSLSLSVVYRLPAVDSLVCRFSMFICCVAGNNEKHGLYKQNKQSKQTFERETLPLVGSLPNLRNPQPLALIVHLLMRYCRV